MAGDQSCLLYKFCVDWIKFWAESLPLSHVKFLFMVLVQIVFFFCHKGSWFHTYFATPPTTTTILFVFYLAILVREYTYICFDEFVFNLLVYFKYITINEGNA